MVGGRECAWILTTYGQLTAAIQKWWGPPNVRQRAFSSGRITEASRMIGLYPSVFRMRLKLFTRVKLPSSQYLGQVLTTSYKRPILQSNYRQNLRRALVCYLSCYP